MIITIEKSNTLKLNTGDIYTISQQYDVNSHNLAFVRPDNYSGFDLILIFQDSGGVQFRYSLKKQNEFLLPEELTQTSYLQLQICFEEGKGFREFSDAIYFTVLPSLGIPDGSENPPPAPSREFELMTAEEMSALWECVRIPDSDPPKVSGVESVIKLIDLTKSAVADNSGGDPSEINGRIDDISERLIEETDRAKGADVDLQTQIDAMQGQTRRFFIDFSAEFGADTPTKAQTDAWLAARTPPLTPNVGTALKNSNTSQSTYNHLFVYYTDPQNPGGLVLRDDGIDTVSTASASSLGIVSGAGGVAVDENGDMFLKPGSATDTVIGNRTLVDNAANATLVPIAAKGVTAWLQGIRDNIKYLITTIATKANLASPALTGTPTAPTAAAGTSTTQLATTAFAATAAANALIPTADRIYPGTDLTVKFATEIAGYSSVWAWIQARIRAVNWTGIHVGDYIPFTADGKTILAEIAGIDTYYKYGDTAVGHHIDFISRDCWPDTHVFNPASYNNGTTVSPSPWLASDLYAWLNSLSMSVPSTATANPTLTAVNYTSTGVYDKFPTALKSVIVQKRVLLPYRYAAGSLLTDDNGWIWQNAGLLWIPSEIEVCGCEHWGSRNGYSGGGFQQYPIFANNMKRIKGAGNGGGRSYWWLLSASGGSSSYFARVYLQGPAASYTASFSDIRVPLCFRIV